MKRLILFFLTTASIQFCYSKNPVILLRSKNNPTIVNIQKIINMPDLIVYLTIVTRGEKFNFINYSNIIPKLYSREKHRFLVFSTGIGASRPLYSGDVLQLGVKTKRTLKLYLKFQKSIKSNKYAYFIYLVPSGEWFITKLKKGLYDLSFKYSIGKNPSKLFKNKYKNLFWKKDLISNSIELRIKE